MDVGDAVSQKTYHGQGEVCPPGLGRSSQRTALRCPLEVFELVFPSLRPA